MKPKPDNDFRTGDQNEYSDLELKLFIYAMHWHGFLKIFSFRRPPYVDCWKVGLILLGYGRLSVTTHTIHIKYNIYSIKLDDNNDEIPWKQVIWVHFVFWAQKQHASKTIDPTK